VVKIRKAFFFDRDGTIIKTKISEKNKPLAIRNLKECKILPSANKILKKLKKNYIIFIITNQPDVARNQNSKKNVTEINSFLKKKLPIKKIYTCYCENNKCKFRKPNIGMLEEASKKYKIDLKESFVVGDRWKDIDAGNRADCKTIFIDKKYDEKLRSKPDYSIKNLFQLRKIIKF
tara:strand:- start:328 stop:855 length:528 start_codon:yes stop_codon:yes gene_type:complete